MGDLSREPSMEDILSSIRRVIARDEAPTARTQRAPAANEDVLDLHDEEDDAVPAPVIPTEEELVSAASADAARQSLEALTAAVAPPATPAPAPAAAGRSMEDVVLDALRPMLKDWLDTNLPAMVEAMVAKEIGRITGKKF
jgi:cell pole-organizing protein PopZ